MLSLLLPLLQAATAPAVDLDQIHYDGYPAQDALAYEVHLEVLADGSYRGQAHYRFRMVDEAPAIYLDWQPAASWSLSFAADEGMPALEVTEGSHVVALTPPAPFAAGEEVSFRATFSGTPAAGLYRDRNRYGATFVYTDHFSSRCRGWLPLEDSNQDRAAFTIDLTVPPGWEAIGSGAWSTLDANGTRYRGVTQGDIPPSLFAFAAGPFARLAETGDERLVPHFVFPQDQAAAKLALTHHAAWMALMEKTFGPYAYAKFTTAQIPTRWGGVEYPGNVWLMQTIYRGADHGVSTLAHEFAHMWFGDGIGYASWQDAWLAEGFASYFGPWLWAAVGGPALDEAMRDTRERWRQSRRAHALPIRWDGYREPDEMYGRAAPNTYQKGALVLHMLRQEVGDEAFFGGLSAWYRAHRNEAVDSASLVTAMSKAAGRDLSWFFSQWLDRPGAPRLAASVDEGGTLHLAQRQEGEAYRLAVEVAWQDADGHPQRAILQMDGKTASKELGAGAHALALDPDAKLLYLAASD